MIWRLDLVLIYIAESQGLAWALLPPILLAYVMLARLDRAFMISLVVLICGMLWFQPLVLVSRALRWWLLGVLAVRGTALVASRRALPASTRGAPRSVLALGAWMLLSALWSDSPVLAVALAGSMACVLVLSFVVVFRLVDQGVLLRGLCRGTLALALGVHGVGLVVAAIAALSGDAELISLTGVHGRLSGVVGNANGNGVFGALFLPILLAAPREYLGRARWLRVVAITVVAASVVFSGSRTANAIAAMVVLLNTLYRFRVGGAFAIVSVIVLATVGFLALPAEDLRENVDQVVVRSGTLADFGGRLELWELGFDVAMERPIIGHGWGGSRSIGGVDVERALLGGRFGASTNLHSAHLVLLVDVGVVGLAMFWWFGATLIAAGLRVVAAPRTPANAVVALVFISSLGLLVDSFVHAGILAAASSNSLLFWSAAAIVIRSSHLLEREPEPAGGGSPQEGTRANLSGLR